MCIRDRTKTLVVELDSRMRRVEEVTGETVDGQSGPAVLIGILDPTTKAHPTQYHGVDTTFAVLRRKVMEFANTMDTGKTATRDSNAMDLSAVNSYLADFTESGLGLSETCGTCPVDDSETDSHQTD